MPQGTACPGPGNWVVLDSQVAVVLWESWSGPVLLMFFIWEKRNGLSGMSPKVSAPAGAKSQKPQLLQPPQQVGKHSSRKSPGRRSPAGCMGFQQLLERKRKEKIEICYIPLNKPFFKV